VKLRHLRSGEVTSLHRPTCTVRVQQLAGRSVVSGGHHVHLLRGGVGGGGGGGGAGEGGEEHEQEEAAHRGGDVEVGHGRSLS
jgi:hypothetical protein